MRSPSANAPSASVRGKAGGAGAGALGAALVDANPASAGAALIAGSSTRLGVLGWFEAGLAEEPQSGKPRRPMVSVARAPQSATFESGVFDVAFMSKMTSYDHEPRVAR